MEASSCSGGLEPGRAQGSARSVLQGRGSSSVPAPLLPSHGAGPSTTVPPGHCPVPSTAAAPGHRCGPFPCQAARAMLQAERGAAAVGERLPPLPGPERLPILQPKCNSSRSLIAWWCLNLIYCYWQSATFAIYIQCQASIYSILSASTHPGLYLHLTH